MPIAHCRCPIRRHLSHSPLAGPWLVVLVANEKSACLRKAPSAENWSESCDYQQRSTSRKVPSCVIIFVFVVGIVLSVRDTTSEGCRRCTHPAWANFDTLAHRALAQLPYAIK